MTTLTELGLAAWNKKKLEDEFAILSELSNIRKETEDKLLSFDPELKPTYDGAKVISAGLSFITDYDTPQRKTRALFMIQICPKCGATERYRIEYLWNIGQAIQENYIGTRHACQKSIEEVTSG